MDSMNTDRPVIRFKLWPPSDNTRATVVKNMANNLRASTFLTKKYGTFGEEEADENAREVEGKAFTAANEQAAGDPDGDGSAAVQFYAKEASRLLLEVQKRGPKQKTDEQVDKNYDNFQEDNEKVEENYKAAEENQDLAFKENEEAMLDSTKGKVFDISKGDRGFLEEAVAEEILKPLSDPGSNYSKIIFSNRSFGLDAARVAERVLMDAKRNLTDVDLSDFIAGRPEDEALQVMQIFSSVLESCVLRTLDLSENALGEKGVRAFGSLLKSQRVLEELYFKNNGISVEAAEAIHELLPAVDKLKILHFHNNMTGDDGAKALSMIVKKCFVLEDFRCSSTRVGTEGGKALCEALANARDLKKLDLRDNMFGREGGIALSQALSGHMLLTEAYLSYLNLKDKGTIAVANSLNVAAPNLKVLEMAGNQITVKAAKALAECLASKGELRKLVFSENELKDQGSMLVCEALLNSHSFLKELDLSENSITKEGAIVAAKVCLNKPDFVLLNLDSNRISEEGIEMVNDILKECQNGVSVLGPLEDNEPDGEVDEEDDGDESEEGSDEENHISDGQEDLEAKLKDLKM